MSTKKALTDRTTLGYLGEEFQFKLIKCFFEDQKFFINIQEIVNQNMFTNDSFRTIVGFMKDRYQFNETVTNYFEMETLLRSKITDGIRLEMCLGVIKEVKEMDLQGMDLVEDESEKFFKQQNLTRVINEVQDIIKRGDFSNYYIIEDKVKKALETNTKMNYGRHLFENIEETLSETFRVTIPTGATKLDEALYGGLAKGELGVIIAPSGVGKAQPLDSKVLTPTGFKTMGEMKVGDRVIGGDGKPHQVIGVYPQGKRPVYKVNFSNGASCECDIDHLWNVISERGVLETLTLREIIDRDLKAGGEYVKNLTYLLPTVKAVEFDEQETLRKPYDVGYDFGLGLSDDIPNYILLNSVKVRRQFIDGLEAASLAEGENRVVNAMGDSMLYSLPDDAADKLKFLFRSLGLYISVSKDAHYDGNAVIISHFEDNIHISGIEYLREDETQCILVDSEEHLYVTDDFIVTHNTSATTGFGANAATYKCEQNNYKGFKVLHYFFEDKDSSIDRKYYGWLTGYDASDLHLPDVRPLVIKKLREDGELQRMLKENVVIERLHDGEVTASDIKVKIRQQIARGFKPDLLILDYFECLKYERGDYNESEWSKEAITMRKIESIANEFDIAIWVPVQGSRETLGAEIVGISQGGGSVKKVQIAHTIVTFAQTEQMKIDGKLNMFLGKFRAGKMVRNKFLNVDFNNGTCRFNMDNIDTDDVPFNVSSASTDIARRTLMEQNQRRK